jgi:hypothetical protein
MFAILDSLQNIVYAMNIVAKFSMNLKRIHYTIMKCTFKHLKGIAKHSFCYTYGIDNNNLVAYADADFVGDLNDYRSRNGNVLSMNQGAILWINKKQVLIT